MRPLPLILYSLAAWTLGPLALSRVTARLAGQGVAPERLAERGGKATLPRPDGPLVWLHGASVGETLSVMPLVARLTAQGLNCLITSGTATSAAILRQRLPQGALHQFAPLDSPVYVTRFLNHWRPDAAVFVESEIWPETLRLLDKRCTPRVLMNARLSARSMARWARWPRVARILFGEFAAIVTQTRAQYNAFAAMGMTNVRVGGNMKASANPPPCDHVELRALMVQLAGRRVWSAVSTHPGEEDAALAAHAAVLRQYPDAVLVLCPRHPNRAPEVASLIESCGMSYTRRSAGDAPGAQVYLADTLGETGLWYRLAQVTFLGASLAPKGGHNPWEVAACGRPLLTGPHVENVAVDMAILTESFAARILPDAAALGPTVLSLFADRSARRHMARSGRIKACSARTNVDHAVALVAGLIPPAASGVPRSRPTRNSPPESPHR
jgi:3-deoxy-D-manno-octulosonic-acid transferase